MRRIAAHFVFPITGEPIPMGVVTLNDEGVITAIGQLENETESMEFYNGILTAGFVNAHCHLELSHLKNVYTSHQGLANFIGQMNSSTRYQTDEETRKAAMVKANDEMQQEGIVAVGDICNTNESFSIKQTSGIFYHSFIEAAGLDEAIADKKIALVQQIIDEAQRSNLAASITPHAAYSMSEKLFGYTIDAANKAEILSVHNEESDDENKLFTTGSGQLRDLFVKNGFPLPAVTGKNSIYRLLARIEKNTRTLFVHNVATNDEDYMATVSNLPHLTWVLCPKSNLQIGNLLPSVNFFFHKNAYVAIGTDSLASNDKLSIIEELKTISANFPQIPLQTLLKWATINGAQALRKENELGSLEVGKKPGMVLIENVNLHTLQLTKTSYSRRLL